MRGPPLIDRAVVDDLLEHLGAEEVRPVFRLFLGECRDLIGRIAAARGDREAVRRAAHPLKSAAGQLGAAALSAAAAALEAAAEQGSAPLDDKIALVERCAAETEAALTALMAPHSRGSDR
ncbi:MAG: Hpt domain-containing protein [Alphaproteobacteria bacterium]|nr:Hpt domain-containing protein [Alphaproteobacteria bacterium]